jgi:hypothetical protein
LVALENRRAKATYLSLFEMHRGQVNCGIEVDQSRADVDNEIANLGD